VNAEGAPKFGRAEMGAETGSTTLKAAGGLKITGRDRITPGNCGDSA
jgi:hypothetical protein